LKAVGKRGRARGYEHPDWGDGGRKSLLGRGYGAEESMLPPRLFNGEEPSNTRGVTDFDGEKAKNGIRGEKEMGSGEKGGNMKHRK